MLKMKSGRHFQAKKTSATPDFCKRNRFRTHGLGVMNVLCFGGTQNANQTVVPKTLTNGGTQNAN